MNMKKCLVYVSLVALALLLVAPGYSQDNRGRAELKTPGGALTIDYGRPSLKGRDMLSQLKEGDSWRMGMNQATVITTPVDLTFGSVKVPKGAYSLWLLKAAGDKFNLVFNSQTGQWGTSHDKSKDVYTVPLSRGTVPTAVETFTLDLKDAPKGGVLEMVWGATRLTTEFQYAK
jgi:hypothetical protein